MQIVYTPLFFIELKSCVRDNQFEPILFDAQQQRPRKETTFKNSAGLCAPKESLA